MHSSQEAELFGRLDRIQDSIAALSTDLRNTRADLGLPLVHTPEVQTFAEMRGPGPAPAARSFSEMQAASAKRQGITPVPVKMKADAPGGLFGDPSYGASGGGAGRFGAGAGIGSGGLAQSTEAERIKTL